MAGIVGCRWRRPLRPKYSNRRLEPLNAALAVTKWKKLSGIYNDVERDHHSTYCTRLSPALRSRAVVVVEDDARPDEIFPVTRVHGNGGLGVRFGAIVATDKDIGPYQKSGEHLSQAIRPL
jgi:hypothetical protein